MINKNILKINKDFYSNDNSILAFITKNNLDLSFNQILSNYSIDIKKIASCNQIHSDKVLYITKPKLYNNVDGLITHINTNIILKIQTADCIPIFIIDQVEGIIGLVHSGWKGTYKNIINNAVSIFIEKKSKIKNINFFLGPSIQSCCYEIKEDVAKYFKRKYVINNKNKIYLNLNKKVYDDLLNLGINKKNIFLSQICTFENIDYCSYRRDQENAGRMYSLLGGLNCSM